MVWWLSRPVRKGQQPPWVVPDELWARIEPLLPVVPRRADHPGRKRLDDRKVLSGILFVLYTGIPWEFLPQELGFGSGMTCWRRLRDWQEAGGWRQLHEQLLAELNAAGALDWSRAVMDSSHVRALKGGPKRARARLTVPGRHGSAVAGFPVRNADTRAAAVRHLSLTAAAGVSRLSLSVLSLYSPE
jgi:transposase